MRFTNLSKAFAASVMATVLAATLTSTASAAVGDDNCNLTSGTGSQASPYLISTPEDFSEIRDCYGYAYDSSATFNYFKLVNNIDLAPNGESWNSVETGWLPIGSNAEPFYGSLDGTGYTISNLFINRNSNQQGLFGYMYSSVVKNLNLESNPEVISISSTPNADYKYSFGALAGEATFSNISNITSNLNVASSSSYVAGIIGAFYNSNAWNIKSSGTISVIGDNYSNINSVGGIFGEMGYASASDLEFSGSLKTVVFANNNQYIDSEAIGGIVGHLYNSTLTDSKNSGSIQGASKTGGVVGNVEYSVMKNIENTGEVVFGFSDELVPFNPFYFGGLVGYMYYNSALINATNTGLVQLHEPFSPDYDNYYVGGAVGSVEEGSMIENVHVKADMLTANSKYVGGLVGAGSNNSGSITNSSFEGEISSSFAGDGYIGGAVGYSDNQFDIANVYTNADISAPSANYVGGFYGYLTTRNGAVSIRDSYARGTLEAFNYAGGFIGFMSDGYETVLQRNYTTVVPVIGETGGEAIVDPFAVGVWRDNEATSVFLASELGESQTGVISATLSEMERQTFYENLGWDFSEGAWRWKISADTNDGLPYRFNSTVVRDGSNLEGAHSSNKLRLFVGALEDGKRTYAINASSKFKNQKAKVIVFRDGQAVRTLIATRLNFLGNKFRTKSFTLLSGDKLVLKIRNKRVDVVEIQ